MAAVLAAGSVLAAAEGSFPAVTAVAVFVDGSPADADMADLVPLAPGQPFSLKRIDDAVKQIYRTGLFADVQVHREGDAGVRLTVILERRLNVRKVLFQGGAGMPSAELRDSLYAIRPAAPYSEEKRVRAVAELREALRKEGYFYSLVDASAARIEGRPSVDVTFKIVPGSRFTLRDVIFSGAAAPDVGILRRRVESRPGRPYNPAVLEADAARIKAYYDEQGYPRAEIAVQGRTFHETDKTVSLRFKIDPQERIRIEVRGANFDTTSLRPFWEERVLEDWSVAQAEGRILSDLRGRGYLFASVRTSLERSPGELRVIHVVEAGEKQRIGEVVFSGNTHFSAAEIKAALGIGPKIPFLSPIGGGELFDVPGRIVRFYESRGFARTRAVLNFRRSGRWTIAEFQVTEGPLQVVERISVSGAALFTPAELLSQVSIRTGGPYDPPGVQRDVGRLESYYQNKGVRGTKIAAAVEQTAEDRFTVEFRLEEGRRVRIDRIVISGLLVTRRSIILRELKLKEGDWAGSEAILETKRGLEKLGVFSEVKIEEVPSGPGTENLVINLSEGERNLVSLGAGLETKNEPSSLDLAQNVIGPRATAEFIRGNMFGRADQLSLITQFSQIERRAVLSWEEPYLFGIRLQPVLNAWLDREALVSYGFDSRGISLGASKSLAGGWRSLTTLGWETTTLYFLDEAENEVDRQHFPYSKTSVSETLLFDRRDDTFNPERGLFFSGELEWAVPLFQVQSDFIKTFFKFQQYVPVIGRWNFSWTARFGLGMGLIPIHERFFAGGSNSFRGEFFDELGPKDLQSLMPVGGKTLALVNAELKFPTFASLPGLLGAIFFDAGNVFAHRDDFSLARLETALGLGLRYKTPLGPVRFDLAWNLNPPPGAGGAKAFITIGNIF
ncbi:MAG: POTRA domain-containing protein [Candidatus Aminicenantales bacterium]